MEEKENNVQDLYPSSDKINTLYTYKTEFSADSVEWCPHEPCQNFFVCANYQLTQNTNIKAPHKRLGCILLFSISPVYGLNLWETIETAAVLDQKWCHNQIEGASILGVVNAAKKIEIYKFKSQNKLTLKPVPLIFRLDFITSSEIKDDGEILMLSLDWSTGKINSEEPEIICTDSKGSWHRFKLVGKELILLQSSLHVHGFEAWIAAFYYWDPNVFFTGGDDSILFTFDARSGVEPINKNKSHSAGVTCIHSNKAREYNIASGSYDELLRIWDIRSMKSPSSQLKMPGSLWRLKWDPFSHTYLLAACMLGGTHIVDSNNQDQLKIIESYYEHKNIVYGADWSFLNESEVTKFRCDGNRIIGTCSFYDHLLCISKLCI